MKEKILIFWKKYSYIIMLCALLVGLVQPIVVLIFIACMLGPALTGFFNGRFWCGNICPIGNFFDNVSVKLSKKTRVPSLFKSIYIKVIATIIMMTMFLSDMKTAWGNPSLGGVIYFQMIMESLIVGTILTVLYSHRAWCHFCPMGSMGAVVSKFSKKKKVLGNKILNLLKMNGGNRSGMALANVDYMGNVHPDQFTQHHNFGNIRESKFSTIWKEPINPIAVALRDRKPLLKGRCSKCQWLGICNGNLRVRAEAVTGNFWDSDPACYLTNKEIGIS